MQIPPGHPRYESLKLREALMEGYKDGITAMAGLIAHGRGEAFDYLLGEVTTPPARTAIMAAAALLILAENPVISVNGNTAAICPRELVALSKATRAKLEVNLFYRSRARAAKIGRLLERHGAGIVYGINPGEEIPGLESERRLVDREGIFSGDVVLVPLEDGDRTEALVKAGKRVIAIDINPISRTARTATITIVDNVVRALPALLEEVEGLRGKSRGELKKLVEAYDRDENLETTLEHICRRLRKNFK
ncbi:MAG: 4-phosphopantoate--beta-alanine ligase [Candidatus Hydrothermarchaeota archaeon]